MSPEPALRAAPRVGAALLILAALGVAHAGDGGGALPALAARAQVVAEQATGAQAAARWRARALYQLLSAGDPTGGVARARVIDAGARALRRELHEAAILARERDRAAAERAAATAALAADAATPPGPAPALAAAVTVAGPVLARFGAARDPETGLAVSRPGVRLAAMPGQTVRAPAAGTVHLVAAEPGGSTVVLDHGGGWTTILGGLAAVDLTPGAHVAASQPLGVARPGGGVTLEVWRGRRPVDPLPLLGRSALAGPAPVP